MAVDASSMQSHTGFATFVETHQGLVIGGGVVAVLVLAGFFMNKNKATLPATAATGAADLSGLTGGRIYVPTQTSFQTENIKYGPQINSNDPNLINVSGTQTSTGNTTTTTTTNPGPTHEPPPVHAPPPPPAKPPTTGGLIYNYRYTIVRGDTLSGIAAQATRVARSRGMPGSMSVTWHDLYSHNQAVIDNTAKQHGYTTNLYNWIFPGEVIMTPSWVRS